MQVIINALPIAGSNPQLQAAIKSMTASPEKKYVVGVNGDLGQVQCLPLESGVDPDTMFVGMTWFIVNPLQDGSILVSEAQAKSLLEVAPSIDGATTTELTLNLIKVIGFGMRKGIWQGCYRSNVADIESMRRYALKAQNRPLMAMFRAYSERFNRLKDIEIEDQMWDTHPQFRKLIERSRQRRMEGSA